jgi:hypothetical protein
MKTIRRCFAIGSILLGAVATGTPDTVIISTIPVAKMLMGIATALNAVSLYLLKEEQGYEEPTKN